VASPFLVATLGASEGVRTALVLSTLVNVCVLAREYRCVAWRRLSPVLSAAIVATPVIALVIGGAHPRPLRAAAGGAVLCGVVLAASGRSVRPSTGGAVIAGIASAAMNLLASASGPAVALYAAGSHWDPHQLRASLQAYFLVLNSISLAVLGLPCLSAATAAALAVAMLVGSVGGSVISLRVAPEAARRYTLLLSACGGMGVLVSALHGSRRCILGAAGATAHAVMIEVLLSWCSSGTTLVALATCEVGMMGRRRRVGPRGHGMRRSRRSPSCFRWSSPRRARFNRVTDPSLERVGGFRERRVRARINVAGWR
jgi:hypothetical protein